MNIIFLPSLYNNKFYIGFFFTLNYLLSINIYKLTI